MNKYKKLAEEFIKAKPITTLEGIKHWIRDFATYLDSLEESPKEKCEGCLDIFAHDCKLRPQQEKKCGHHWVLMTPQYGVLYCKKCGSENRDGIVTSATSTTPHPEAPIEKCQHNSTRFQLCGSCIKYYSITHKKWVTLEELLHQRDLELKDKIEGMKKDENVEFEDRSMAFGKGRVEDYRFGYNEAVEEVLTLLK